MTRNENTGIIVKGTVHGYMFDVVTGEITRRISRRNVTTYAAADIMARLIGNEVSYVPRYMGFIYGPNAVPATDLIRPPLLDTTRLQLWSSIGADELSATGVAGNVLISPLAAGPQYTVNGSATNYTGNSVTLTAHTGARLEYGFPTGTGGYASDFADSDYIYQAMLVTRLVDSDGVKTYLPFARADLAEVGPVFPQKTAGYEFALFWDIAFF